MFNRKLSDYIKMCDKIHGHRRINVFISMFGKSVLTKHLERARDLVGELQLKSLVRHDCILKHLDFALNVR